MAAQRSAIARKRNITDAKVGPQDSLQIDIDGLMGEFAFAKLCNVWPDLQVGNRSINDVETAIGGVDVKTTRYSTGRLLATKKKQEIASDWYALMLIKDDNTIDFVGAASAGQLLNDKNLKDLGRGTGYALDQKDLISPEEFLGMLAKEKGSEAPEA